MQATCTKECAHDCRALERQIRFAKDGDRWYAYAAHDTPKVDGWNGSWCETLATGATREEVRKAVRS